MSMKRCAPNITAAASLCRPHSKAPRVLDLGSGSGRGVYLIAQLFGPNGEVVGVDMTDEQLATAEAHSDWTCDASASRGRTCASLRAISRGSKSLDSNPRVST